MAYRILVVDDEKLIVKGIKFSLEQDGMEVTAAYDGEEALQHIKEETFDLVVLDVMLPKMDGLQVCQQVREFSQIPIIMVTAKGEDMDKIMGLEYGADDYITKPFKLAVFLSRVNALLRRSENFSQAATELNSNGITIQLLKHEVYKDDVLIDLTASEYKLLCLFMENPNIVLSSEQILSRLWDCEENYIDSSTLTVYIRRLRTKIEDDPANPQNIVTVRRMGYKWNTAGRDA